MISARAAGGYPARPRETRCPGRPDASDQRLVDAPPDRGCGDVPRRRDRHRPPIRQRGQTDPRSVLPLSSACDPIAAWGLLTMCGGKPGRCSPKPSVAGLFPQSWFGASRCATHDAPADWWGGWNPAAAAVPTGCFGAPASALLSSEPPQRNEPARVSRVSKERRTPRWRSPDNDPEKTCPALRQPKEDPTTRYIVPAVLSGAYGSSNQPPTSRGRPKPTLSSD
jgi:hypothetical protein